MNVPVEEDGTLGIVDGISAAGQSLRPSRAEVEVLTLISNCPQINNPCKRVHTDCGARRRTRAVD